MANAAELDALEAKPLAIRRMYIACDCNTGGRGKAACVGTHTSAALEGKPSKVCPECGDTGEAHYLMVPVTSDGYTTFYAARRGHDDDDPATRASGEACEGSQGLEVTP